jgi:hypothetical protein
MPRQLDELDPIRTLADGTATGAHPATANAQRYFDIWRAGSMPGSDATLAVNMLLARPATDLSGPEWLKLRALLESRHAARFEVPAELPGVYPLAQIAAGIAMGRGQAGPPAQLYFDAWRMNRMMRVDAVPLAQGLLRRPAASLGREEWQTLAALLGSRHADDIGVVDTLPGLKPFGQIAIELGSGRYLTTHRVQRYFDAWGRLHDPTYRDQVGPALEAIVRGHATDADRALVVRDADIVDKLTAGRRPEDQLAIAAVMLHDEHAASSTGIYPTLLVLHESLGAIGAPAELRSVHDETMTLLERNLLRIDRSAPVAGPRGFSNHPDYAEIGRIRANVDLLLAAGRRPQPPASAPAPSVAPAGASLPW